MDHIGRLQEISDPIKQNKIRIIGFQRKKKERERVTEGIFEQIIPQNTPNLGK